MRRTEDLFTLCLMLGAVGCALDDRTLEVRTRSTPDSGLFDSGSGGARDAESALPDAESAEATAPAGRDASTGHETGSGSGGSAPEADGAPPPEPCDRVDRQIMVVNPTLDTDVDGWSPDPGTTGDWSSEDARGSRSSGSMRIENGSSYPELGSTQCVAITPKLGYQICVDYYLANDAPAGAAVGVRVTLFDGEDCTAAQMTRNPPPVRADQRDRWSTARLAIDAPPARDSFHSMSIRLVSVKVGDAAVAAQFDNVRIGEVPD